jgi:hypothetical protein
MWVDDIEMDLGEIGYRLSRLGSQMAVRLLALRAEYNVM